MMDFDLVKELTDLAVNELGGVVLILILGGVVLIVADYVRERMFKGEFVEDRMTRSQIMRARRNGEQIFVSDKKDEIGAFYVAREKKGLW
ncbi:hypothetical protein JD969_15130 [Planctomycetota bacterium]|nr:hypothetical protein JD969_15130 [Planctomycetota bacterium]